ncbi:siderophore biosynthesis protein [Nostoc sp.]|uniref:siderophore biosynthesis protein n=1 Tax=Nostoc sp. TaxID=1180 RepID=UPI002FF93061
MTTTETQAKLKQLWEGFHWLFFVDVQGLIICLRRFEMELAASNFHQAEVELRTATKLMLASGAAMELAGSCFSKEEYENQILPTMKPPQVQSENFSGLMSWDHALLIKILKRLSPVFQDLPVELHIQHSQFVNAYVTLSNAHTAVCTRFGGDEKGSLRCNKSTAVSKLKIFAQNRLKLINSNRKITNS